MKAKLQIVAAMLIFGSMGLLIRQLTLPSSVIAVWRGIIGMFFLWGLGWATGKRVSLAALRANAVPLVFSGIALGINWIFLFEAYRHTSISVATLSYYLAPVFLVLMSCVILKEPITPLKGLCVLLALFGMVLVSGVGLSQTTQMGEAIGIGFGIGAALSYATLTLVNKLLKDISSLDATMVQLGIAALVLVPYGMLNGDFGGLAVDSKTVILIFVLGIVYTGLAFWFYFSGVHSLKAQTVAVLSYIDPVTAILLSAWFLQERLGLWQFVGAFLILGSTLFHELFGRRLRPTISNS